MNEFIAVTERVFSRCIHLVTDPILLPSSRTFVLYLASSLLIAIVAHVFEARKTGLDKGVLRSVFSKEVYLHPSALVDYLYFICNTLLGAVLLAPVAGFSLFVSRELSSLIGSHVGDDMSWGWGMSVALTLILVVVADFSSFLVHVLMHRVPLLWEFHKVHHSAEVMTPITVYRMHPVDDLLTLLVSGVLTGATDALLRSFVWASFPLTGLYGISVLTFLFYLFGYNLRHSHVWVSYGSFLSKLFISPAQHQIHHSKASRHWNKNYGFMFAFWDLLAGSLYIPKEREDLEFGIGSNEDGQYSSVLRLYLLPFTKVFSQRRRGK